MENLRVGSRGLKVSEYIWIKITNNRFLPLQSLLDTNKLVLSEGHIEIRFKQEEL